MISIIAAMDEKRGIGKDNGLMWHIPGELPRFKGITMGHPIIMGRKTFESIGRPLPGRLNIVITHNPFKVQAGVILASSFDDALKIASEDKPEEIFVIGGGQIFNQAISKAQRLYLTLVEGDFKADTFFPDYQEFKKIVSEEKHEEGEYKYKFLTLEK